MFPLNLYKQMIELFKAKAVWLVQLVAAFLMPIKGLIFIVVLFIILDTISGIWAAKKRKEKITSHKISRVISKIALYCTALASLFTLDYLLIGEIIGSFISIQFFLTKMVAVFFVGVEVMSINENIKSILGVNLFGMLRKLLLRAKEVKEDLVDIADVKSKDEETFVE